MFQHQKSVFKMLYIRLPSYYILLLLAFIKQKYIMRRKEDQMPSRLKNRKIYFQSSVYFIFCKDSEMK